jgi:hypothetical protein
MVLLLHQLRRHRHKSGIGGWISLGSNATGVRACSVPFYVRISEYNFVDDKEKIRRNIARIFDAAGGKICRKDVRKKILNRL